MAMHHQHNRAEGGGSRTERPTSLHTQDENRASNWRRLSAQQPETPQETSPPPRERSAFYALAFERAKAGKATAQPPDHMLDQFIEDWKQGWTDGGGKPDAVSGIKPKQRKGVITYSR